MNFASSCCFVLFLFVRDKMFRGGPSNLFIFWYLIPSGLAVSLFPTLYPIFTLVRPKQLKLPVCLWNIPVDDFPQVFFCFFSKMCDKCCQMFPIPQFAGGQGSTSPYINLHKQCGLYLTLFRTAGSKSGFPLWLNIQCQFSHDTILPGISLCQDLPPQAPC